MGSGGSRRRALAACAAVLLTLLCPKVAGRLSSTGLGRQLAQDGSPVCPPGCAPGFCVQSSTGAGVRCQKCLNNLVVDKVTGRCACPAGFYSEPGDSCAACSVGHFCPGGFYTYSSTPSAPQSPCPANMTTLGMRSRSQRNCVNRPGFSYALDAQSNPMAVLCPVNTWSAGLKKQRACVPCPTGFVNQQTGASSPTSCGVPQGSYLKAPGVAAPCPRGEYKAGLDDSGNCSRCSFGVTTAKEGSASEGDCSVLLPGLFAASIAESGAITATGFCPQGFVCPGGQPARVFDPSNPSALPASATTVQACPEGLWTKKVGSTSLSECLTPPGFYTADGQTKQCPPGSFRADWQPAGQATSCASCGQGVLADATDRVTKYPVGSTDPQEIAVSTSSQDCYILPGQGLYFETLSNSLRAANCTVDKYGVSNTTYGLSPSPCRSCPTGTEARASLPASAQHLAANGFVSEKACVTKPGHGYVGRVGVPCGEGSYSPGGNLDACKACPRGMTTRAVGAGRSITDCVAAPGFGASGSSLGPCPIGTYSELANTTCTACPKGTTTQDVGSDAKTDCQFCVAGYGGKDCADTCGGVGEAASYGPPGRALHSSCLPCSDKGKTVGFSFYFALQNDLYVPRTVSRPRASSASDCLSEYAQAVDSAWWLPLSSSEGTNTTTGVPSFAACVDICSATGCQLLTYDYVAQTCLTRVSIPATYEDAPFLALKTINSGYVGTSSVGDAGRTGNASAKVVTSGSYIFYQEPYAMDVGIQKPAPGAADFINVADCSKACDDDSTCAGFTVRMTVDPWRIGTTCRLVFGDATQGRFKRSMVRTDLDRIGFRTTYLCPSGFNITEEIVRCTPITTVQAAVFVLTAQGTCDAATIQSVKDSIANFMSDPTAAFGVYVPNLIVEVSCISIQTTQATFGGNARRLLSAETNSTVAFTVQAKYTGSRMGSENVVEKLDKLVDAQCTVPGLCDNLQGATLRRSWTDPAAVQSGTLNLTVVSANESSLVVRAVYKEGGEKQVDMPIFVVLEDQRVRVPCVQSLDGPSVGSRLFTCAGPLESNISLSFTATAPNTIDPAKPVTTSVTYTSCADDVIRRFAGNLTSQNTTEGIPALEHALTAPIGLAFDLAGNTLLSDEGTNQVFKVDRASGLITVFAGRPQEPEPVRRRLLAGAQQPNMLRDWLRRPQQPEGNETGSSGAHASAQSAVPKQGTVRAASGDLAAELGEDVPAVEASFVSPSRMVVDTAGNTYIADTFAHAVRVVSASTGRITTYAGTLGSLGFGGDGGPATAAQLYAPVGLALHPQTGDLYIADSLNCRIRRVDAATGTISTFAGNGCPCSLVSNEDCVEAGAVFGSILPGLAFDSAGSLFVVDRDFNVVWKIPAGSSTPELFAGVPHTMEEFFSESGPPVYGGDGDQATNATVWFPIDVAVHPQYDDVFIAHWPADSAESAKVRRVDALSGVIYTEVGGAAAPERPVFASSSEEPPFGEEPAVGDGGPPSLAFVAALYGIGVGPHGSLMLAENVVVRNVSCSQF